MSKSKHGGDLRRLAREAGRDPGEILDFSANINPLGAPSWLRQTISRHVRDLVHYPDPESTALVEAVATRYDSPRETIVVGNGSAELLYLLVQAATPRRAIIPTPSYLDYARAAHVAGLPVTELPLIPARGFRLDIGALELDSPAIVIIGRPNNPTGTVCEDEVIRTLARRHPGSLFIIDEAFGDFVENFDSLTRDRPDNVAVLLSLTKNFAIPGLRLGCAIASPELARKVRGRQPPWSVNTLAQAAGSAALRDTDFITRSREVVTREREWLQTQLGQIPGIMPFPGTANFLLLRLTRPGPDSSQGTGLSEQDHARAGDSPTPDAARRLAPANAESLAAVLLKEHGIAIRVCANFSGLDKEYFRIAVRTRPENERLVTALDSIFHSRSRIANSGRPQSSIQNSKFKVRNSAHTPALMFQGTSSNAGKSVLTAAFCRILLQDGYRVAPFKAQNMSLNSCVTRDGGEMGRAQIVQAQACHIEPDVRMNPVLLKPNSATGSQVIVMGKPVGNMNVHAYIQYKPEVFKTVCRAYDELASSHDIVILEGAGSPGEVNLKRHDIVNMEMARYAGAPVLLVGDIDRGGVYAAFVGIMEVLDEWERDLVAGFMVNRFRGQESLLKDANEYVLRHTGRPVLGVVPHIVNLNIPEEDSVTFKSGALDRSRSAEASIDIAVVDLPHISNFTDFDAFRGEPDVHLRIVRTATDLGSPDAVILPGSKNTLADLGYLRKSGLAARIATLAGTPATEIIGVCGGFQMIGREIMDPERIESGSGRAPGLGLLDISTVMQGAKTLCRTGARHVQSGLTVQGYEIHHGRTRVAQADALFIRPDHEIIGASGPDGRVWGTYLHGVFDADPFRRWFINRLRARRGWAELDTTHAYDIEPALEHLAEVVRSHVNMKDIYRIMGLR